MSPARPLAFGLAAFVAGCCGMCAETTPSQNIRTEGLAEEVGLEADGTGKTNVGVTLRAGGRLSNLYPRLSDGDRLEARSGTDVVPLSFGQGLLSAPVYTGKLPGDGGRSIEIHFTRTGNTSATGTRVTMPPAFSLSAPPEGARLSAASPAVTVVWSPPSAAALAWSVNGDCIMAESGTQAPDTGRLELSLRAAPPLPDAGPTRDPCDVRIRLERTARGTIDPAFGEGGYIQARQVRTRTLHFTP